MISNIKDTCTRKSTIKCKLHLEETLQAVFFIMIYIFYHNIFCIYFIWFLLCFIRLQRPRLEGHLERYYFSTKVYAVGTQYNHLWAIFLMHHQFVQNLDKALLIYVITKTHLYNFDPNKPHFYIVKMGFTGVYIIFNISARKHRLWVLVGLMSTHNLCFEQKYEKNIRVFYLKIFSLWMWNFLYIWIGMFS